MRKEEDLHNNLELLLRDMGIDMDREELRKTPERVVHSLRELIGIKGEEDTPVATFSAPNYDAWVKICDIPFESLCEHHLLPMVGKISIAYWPCNGRVVGLSKLVRWAQFIAHRLQLQERMTVELGA
ncbi:MAG: GTP cyclohydrolase I, partial [Puniceicoccales bacterium]|nr:GTP cyclohydrolase I [Puniceicoccales bacterium]